MSCPLGKRLGWQSWAFWCRWCLDRDQGMSKASRIICLGINHRTTPVEVREKLAFAEAKVPEATREVVSIPGFDESVILSTCNRVELYAAHSHEDPKQPLAALVEYLIEHFQLAPDQAEALVTYPTGQPRRRRGICSAWSVAWTAWCWARRRSLVR